MTIPVVQVTASFKSPGGVAVSGVRVTATLSEPIIVADVVIPQSQTQTTDVNGACILALCPNSLSSPVVTTYTIEIRMPNSNRSIFYYDVVVPSGIDTTTLSHLLGFAGSDILLYWSGGDYWSGSTFWG